MKFFRTPKGLMLLVLALLLAIAAPAEGLRQVLPGLVAAIAAAAAIDLPILHARTGAWPLPSGAILTGLFVAMVLSPHEPWWIAAVAAAVGVGAKYLFRTRTANVFNPAALGLVVVYYAFDAGQSWWGALPDVTPWALLVLVATGAFITNRVNKAPLVLAFLGGYYLLFTVAAFVGDPAHVAEIFRAPDLHASLFFACFILTDPPTAPARYPEQVACGLIVAATACAIFEWLGAAHYLLAGVLVGNLWEARRRWSARVRPRRVQPATSA